MIKYEEIREVHLELSTNCNASCPLCPRNFNGYPYNAGYPDTELTLDDVKKIFPPKFIKQLKNIIINGNLGDFMLCRDSLEIIEYFRSCSNYLIITINTNGSARNSEFWTRLAKSNPAVYFCLDGLDDTHSIYRRDTQFQTIIKNIKTFMLSGGNAAWKMIKFKHNEHQIDQCRRYAKSLGIKTFLLVEDGRDSGLVFSKNGNLEYVIGNTQSHESIIQWHDHLTQTTNGSRAQYKLSQPVKKQLDCYSNRQKSIYITANGEVYPCCYLGFYPRTYDANLLVGNNQINELLHEVHNNAKDKPLVECIEWFNKIESTWSKQSYADGRLYGCDSACGCD